jgi:hypothetical protein
VRSLAAVSARASFGSDLGHLRALAADDALNAGLRFRVRETSEWKLHARNRHAQARNDVRGHRLVRRSGAAFVRGMMGGGSGPRPLERIGQEAVIYYAQKQTDHWPNENATDRASIDNAGPRLGSWWTVMFEPLRQRNWPLASNASKE